MPELTKTELIAKNNQLQEKLYDNGVDTRPTLMSDIEAIEIVTNEKLAKLILTYKKKQENLAKSFNQDSKVLFNTCTKETGREFSIPINLTQCFPSPSSSSQTEAITNLYDWKDAIRRFRQASCLMSSFNYQLYAIINEEY